MYEKYYNKFRNICVFKINILDLFSGRISLTQKIHLTWLKYLQNVCTFLNKNM